MGLVYSAFVPHPPIIVSEVGRGEEQVCTLTINAYKEVASRLLKEKVDTIVVISPHTNLIEEGLVILSSNTLLGDFGNFGAPHLRLSFLNDQELIKSLLSLPNMLTSDEWELDHGTLVPLYFMEKSGWSGKVVVIGMPLKHYREYGHGINIIFNQQPKRIALLASGDLSHYLKEDGPNGFNPAGAEFDSAIVSALKSNPSDIFNIDPKLITSAGECGYRSLAAALGVREGAVEVLSYEGPFGVGYLVAELYRSSPLAHWARSCLNHYLNGGDLEQLQPPKEGEFTEKKACFVTLKSKGELRGCIGTTQPIQENLALEIMHNSIAAGTEDPRFWAVEKEELIDLSFSVDVLGNLETVSDPSELDPWRYGVVVMKNGRTGLLLPHLEGVDTVAQQIMIAKQKAGISPEESVELWKFEVVRHYE